MQVRLMYQWQSSQLADKQGRNAFPACQNAILPMAGFSGVRLRSLQAHRAAQKRLQLTMSGFRGGADGWLSCPGLWKSSRHMGQDSEGYCLLLSAAACSCRSLSIRDWHVLLPLPVDLFRLSADLLCLPADLLRLHAMQRCSGHMHSTRP